MCDDDVLREKSLLKMWIHDALQIDSTRAESMYLVVALVTGMKERR